MREILFTAKAINRDKGYHRTKYKNGDWVYGLVTRLYDERFENLPAEMTDINGISGIEVDYKTIRQYTGLTDDTTWEDLSDEEKSKWLLNHNEDEWDGKMIFEGDIVQCTKLTREQICGFVVYGSCCFSVQDINSRNRPAMDLCKGFKVIGNIYDNPELLRGELNEIFFNNS